MGLKQVLIAFDQLVNTLIGGMADETLSAAAWRWQMEGKRRWAYRLIDTLFFFEPNHCQQAWRSELLRSHLPTSYRGRA